MNGTWSFVDESGAYTGANFTGPEHALADNTPPGCRAVVGRLERDPDRHDPELQRARTVERIHALEQRQLRPMRELQIDPQNAEAVARLAAIDAQIAALRAAL